MRFLYHGLAKPDYHLLSVNYSTTYYLIGVTWVWIGMGVGL